MKESRIKIKKQKPRGYTLWITLLLMAMVLMGLTFLFKTTSFQSDFARHKEKASYYIALAESMTLSEAEEFNALMNQNQSVALIELGKTKSQKLYAYEPDWLYQWTFAKAYLLSLKSYYDVRDSDLTYPVALQIPLQMQVKLRNGLERVEGRVGLYAQNVTGRIPPYLALASYSTVFNQVKAIDTALNDAACNRATLAPYFTSLNRALTERPLVELIGKVKVYEGTKLLSLVGVSAQLVFKKEGEGSYQVLGEKEIHYVPCYLAVVKRLKALPEPTL